jgi:hypothetical protein
MQLTLYRKLYRQFDAFCGNDYSFLIQKRTSVMVMNTCSRRQINRDARVRLESVIQNNPQPPSCPLPGCGVLNRIAALEAQIETLTQHNAKLLPRRPGQSHLEENRDGHEEEQRNNHTDAHSRREEDHREDDHQEDNFWKVNPRELRIRRPDRHGDQWEDAGDLSKVIAELKRMCTYMEMERKEKNRSMVVDKLLMGTDSPFTKRVANYHLPMKFKVPQILSYAGEGDPLDHLENF